MPRIYHILTIYLVAFSLKAQESTIGFTIYGSDTLVTGITVAGQLDAQNTRKYQEESIFRYSGSGAENLVAIELCNTGNRVIRNPQLTINGIRWVYNFDDLISRIPLHAATTSSDTLRMLWFYLYENFYHWNVSTADAVGRIHPLQSLSVFGSGFCENNTQVITSILSRLSYPVQTVLFGGSAPHTLGATTVAGLGTVPLDADIRTVYLKRDNRTLATFDDIFDDPDLIHRTHHYGFQVNERQLDTNLSLILNRDVPFVVDDWSSQDSLELKLRPGERYVWNFSRPLGTYFHYYNPLVPGPLIPPPTGSLGLQEYSLDDSVDLLEEMIESNLTIDSIGLHPVDPSIPASGIVLMSNPYAITGGQVTFSYERVDSESNFLIFFRKDTVGDFLEIYRSASESIGLIQDSVDLFEVIEPQSSPITNRYQIKIEFKGGTSPVVVKSFTLLNYFQFNPNLLPRLQLGDNTIEVQSSDNTRLEGLSIAYSFNKVYGTVPDPVVEPLFPTSGSTVSGSEVEFRWSYNGPVSDFLIIVSDRPDCMFPLSSSFYKLVSMGGNSESRWSTPSFGMLNPDQDYYWRVRVRSVDGVWSAWSDTWSFRVQCPSVPVDLKILDAGDSLSLTWSPGSTGTSPVAYVVLGDFQQGFGFDTSHVIDTLYDNRMTIWSESVNHVFPYYRVMALDASGRFSGISEPVSLTDRLFVHRLPIQVQSETPFSFPFTLIEPEFVRVGTTYPQRKIDRKSVSFSWNQIPPGLEMQGSTLKGSFSFEGLLQGRATRTDGTYQDVVHVFEINHVPHAALSDSVAYCDQDFDAVIQLTDADGDSAYISSVSSPSWLHFEFTSNRLFGVPDIASRGDTVVVCTIHDARGAIWEDTLELRVAYINQAPVFLVVEIPHALDNAVYNGRVYATDSDSIMGDHVRYYLVEGPAWLKIDSLNGYLTGQPQLVDLIDSLLIVRATDMWGSSTDTALTLRYVNHVPYVRAVNDSLNMESNSYYVWIDAVDADTLLGDSLCFRVISKPDWLREDGKGFFSGQYALSESGDTIRIGIYDRNGDSTIIVNAVDNNAFLMREQISIDSLLFVDSLYKISLNTEKDAWSEVFKLEITRKPNWLTFDTTRQLLIAVAPSSVAGKDTVAVRVYRTISQFVEKSFVVYAAPATNTPTIPEKIELLPNYPNPFNGSTIIPFQVSVPSRIRVEVFNVLGQRIERIVDDEFLAGYYLVPWVPKAVASGTYFVRMMVKPRTGARITKLRRVLYIK